MHNEQRSTQYWIHNYFFWCQQGEINVESQVINLSNDLGSSKSENIHF